MNDVRDIVLAYASAGLSVIPVFCDGTKRPAISWKDYQARPATEEELSEFFGGDLLRGIGIVCGAVSGNLEVLDFDEPDYFEEWLEAVEELSPGILEKVTRIATPTGIHLWYRCETIERNQKLAQTETADVAIETRGEGGYVIAPGSPLSVHPSGDPYEQVSGPRPTIEGVPTITVEERAAIIQAAKVLNRFVRTDRIEGGRRKTIETSVEGMRPGDVYNQKKNIDELIEEIGGTAVYHGKNNEIRWARPGKEDKGWSATTGHCSSSQTGDLFYVFSSGWAPFEPDRAYSAFAVFTLFFHDGDYQAAARDLLRQGYGATEYPELEEKLQEATSTVREENKAETRQHVEEIVTGLRRASRQKVTNLWGLRSTSPDDRSLSQESIDTRLISLMVRARMSYSDIVRVIWVHRADEPEVEPDKALEANYMAGKIGFIQERAEVTPTNQDLGARCAAAQGEENAPPSKREQDRKEKELEDLEAEEYVEVIESNEKSLALEEFKKRTQIDDIYGVIRQGEDPWECAYIILLDNNERLLIGSGETCLRFHKFRIPIFNHFAITLREEIYKPLWDEVIQLLRLAAVDEVIAEDRPHEQLRSLLSLYLQERTTYDEESAFEGVKRREPLLDDGRLGLCTQSILNFIFAKDPSWKIQRKELYHQLRSLGFDNERVSRRGEDGNLAQAFYWWIPFEKLWVSVNGVGDFQIGLQHQDPSVPF